jgi:Tfp pilus assembly protein PilO
VQVKTKSLIVGVLAVVIVGLVWFQFLYSPIKSKTSKANAAAQSSQTEVDSLQQQIDQLNAADKKAKAKDIGSAQMLQAVPADAAEASFLRSLDQVRAASGASWQSTTPSTPAAAGNVTSIGLSIEVQGTEAQLARYLQGLYTMRRIFIADNVTLSANGCTDLSPCPGGALFKGADMQLTITGRVFAGPAAAPTSLSTTARPSTAASTASSATSSSSTSG